jgi:Trk-type K+ transport system membrane component
MRTPAGIPAPSRFRARRPFSPAQVLVLTFLGLITTGTILLSLPAAATRAPLSLVDAFFTATSAVCVTGLIVVDRPVALSTFAQVVVLLLVQAGGLGYMAITTIVGVALGRQLTVHERLTLQEAMNVESMEGLARFVITVLKLTLAFEAVGALILTVRWTGEFGLAQAAYYGVFHAVSAFNDAGFALFSDSLIRFRGDWIVNLVVSGLVISGGLGFIVLTERLADVITHALQIDATDEKALRATGIQDVDVAVVSIGENIESSLLVVMLLREIGVKTIVAKAVTPLHGRILEKLGVSRVIFPEREMAIRIAHSLVMPSVIDYTSCRVTYRSSSCRLRSSFWGARCGSSSCGRVTD